MHRFWCGAFVLSLACLLPVGAAPDEKAKPGGDVVVTDIDGKETRLTAAKLTPAGTRRMGWLADPKGTTPDEKLGPLAIEVREVESTTLKLGVLTFIPAASLETAKYDYEKRTATLSLKGAKEPVIGTLQFTKLNVLGISGTVDGKATTFSAGVPGKAAVKSITFPDAKALPAPKAGITWAVQITQKEPLNPTLKVRNLKALYHFTDGSESLSDLPVRKGPSLPFDDKLTRFEILANDPNTNFATAEVEVGGMEKVIVIPLTMEKDKRTGTLTGLLGEEDTGYKLFPLHTIKVVKPFVKKTD